MGDAGFFKGTSADQDVRFPDKKKKLLKSTSFAPILSTKVDMKKVDLPTIKLWITKRVTQLIGIEDDVLVDYIFGQLEQDTVDPNEMQINITGFLNKNAGSFMAELWELLVSAQQSPLGIPKVLLEQTKEQIRRERAEHGRLVDELKKQREQEESGRLANRPAPRAEGERKRRWGDREDQPRAPDRDRERERRRSPSPRRRRDPSRERDVSRERDRDRDRRRVRSRSRERERRKGSRERSRERKNRSRSRSKSRERERNEGSENKERRRRRSRS
ncbi:PWI domain-containing protein [Cladochytrium replicatum]|nr:PWI domain-containing protein [Cladochytrium replicatum]